MECLNCNKDSGKKKWCDDKCRMRWGRNPNILAEGSEQVAGEIRTEYSKSEQDPNKKSEQSQNPNKSDVREFTKKQREDLLKQKKRACWVDVFEYPDLTYSESVIKCLGDSPNAIFAASAKEVVESEDWDPSRAFEFNAEIF